jgi:hypothetical protein
MQERFGLAQGQLGPLLAGALPAEALARGAGREDKARLLQEVVEFNEALQQVRRHCCLRPEA